ncbi:hypothetical protein ZWY2020_004650 [Hordeum vulgare]|nr:hypothetical protein ZWY2020_004650 [Hordeum vulgare]
MCSNCGCAGHFRSECEAPPRCPTTLAYLGYGIERGSFYYVDAEIEEEVASPHLASVTLAPDEDLPPSLLISADHIQAELAAYIGDLRDFEFAWEVTETAPLAFSVPLPSVELLWVCSHDFIRCPINKFLISVHATTAEPDPVPPLEKVWVLVYGLLRGGSAAPRGGKHTHILKAISESVGKLITADLASFEDDGPARIEIPSPAPAKIDGLSLIFYFGTKGKRLTFELESPVPGDPLDPAPSAFGPGDAGIDDEGARLRRAPSLLEMMMMEGLRLLRLMVGGPRSCLSLDLLVSQGGLPWWPWRRSLRSALDCPLLPLSWQSSGKMRRAWAWRCALPRPQASASSPRSPEVVYYSRSPWSPPSPALGSPDQGSPPAMDPDWLTETPPAPCSRPREGASSVVSARQSARISQSRILLDGRAPDDP